MVYKHTFWICVCVIRRKVTSYIFVWIL
jgi:hypothetical protein